MLALELLLLLGRRERDGEAGMMDGEETLARFAAKDEDADGGLFDVACCLFVDSMRTWYCFNLRLSSCSNN